MTGKTTSDQKLRVVLFLEVLVAFEPEPAFNLPYFPELRSMSGRRSTAVIATVCQRSRRQLKNQRIS